MAILSLLFFISLLGGQIFRIPLYGGIAVYPHDLMLGILILFWLCFDRNRKNARSIRFQYPLKLFYLSILISLALNMPFHTLPDFAEGVAYALRFFLYSFLFIIVSNTKSGIRWIQGLYGVGSVFALIGIIQYVLYPNLRNLSYLGWDPHYYRLFSTFLDPNFAGLFILLGCILGIFMYEKYNKRIIIPMQIILATGVILTLSRSTYLACVGAVIAYAVIRKSWKVFGILVLLITILAVAPFPGRGYTPLLRKETSIARIGNWTGSIALFRKAPVFGHGFNLLRSIQEPDTADAMSISHATSGVDNSFLFVLTTTGVVGGAAFLYFLYSLWKMGRNLRMKKCGDTLGTVYLLSLVALCIHSLFINSFFYPWILIWLWIISGVVEGISCTGKKRC